MDHVPQEQQELFNLCDIWRLLDPDTPMALVPPRSISKLHRQSGCVMPAARVKLSSHLQHSAVIRSEVDSAPVGTSVGFKQGCVLAPPLFNVCLDSVMRQLLPQLQQLGVTICYKIDGQLMHCKNPTEEVLMWILLYADDISLACDTAEKLRAAVITMDATFLRWGLTISTKKIKVLVVGRNAAAQAADSVITRCVGIH